MDKIPYFEDQDSKIKPELPIVERETVNVVVYDPKTDRVICLDWEKFNWKTFIAGGVEAGEDPAVSARREVKEETGYQNLEFVAEVAKYQSAYYATHKKENRLAHITGFLFKLIDDTKVEVQESETVNHVLKWIPKNEVAGYVNLDAQKYLWKKTLEILDK